MAHADLLARSAMKRASPRQGQAKGNALSGGKEGNRVRRTRAYAHIGRDPTKFVVSMVALARRMGILGKGPAREPATSYEVVGRASAVF